jgi:hypothetical protein
MRHSRAADDRRNRDLKRDSEHGMRDGLHFEPALMSDELLPRSLPDRKIKRCRAAAHPLTRDKARPIVANIGQAAGAAAQAARLVVQV